LLNENRNLWFNTGSRGVQACEMEINRSLLIACLAEIEGLLGWGESSSWSHDDFENLSRRIWQKTGTRLSLSTMRRIWGRVRYEHSPNIATLNALAAFLGYADWRDYSQKLKKESCGSVTLENVQVSRPNIDVRPGSGSRPYLLRWALISSIVLGMVILFGTRRPRVSEQQPSVYNYILSARKVTDDLPNSVIFTYDAGPEADTKVVIQQSWDSSRRELVDSRGKEHTSIYYYPGYFLAKLTVNDHVVRETPVYIKTKGWKAIAEREDYPVYFKSQSIWQKERLVVTAIQMRKALQTDQFNNKWLQFANIREFPAIDGNNFRFETSLRNTATVEESLCRKVRVILLGTNYPIILPLAEMGCVSDIYGYLGDSSLNGKKQDLSAFGCDFSKSQLLTCEVKGRVLKILLNNSIVLATPHVQPIGHILGIRVVFEGPGEIEQMTISSPGGSAYDLLK
jgi:hypothetical protein